MCHERIYLIKQNARIYMYLNFETTTHNTFKTFIGQSKTLIFFFGTISKL